MQIIKRLLGLAALAAFALAVSGCRTTAGFGEDLANGGNAIKNSADKHSD